MKTKLFLFAALFITTITFSQTTKKGYDHYSSASANRMNKGELIDAMAKDANNSRKVIGKMGNHPNISQTSHNWIQTPARAGKKSTMAPNYPIPGIDITVEQGYQDGNDLHVRKRPGRTKATDYNSSRQNKKG